MLHFRCKPTKCKLPPDYWCLVSCYGHHKENTKFMPRYGYETAKCQLDSGSSCEVMTLWQCHQILQNSEPKITPSRSCLRFYDVSTNMPVGVCRFKCRNKEHEIEFTFQMADANEVKNIPPLLLAKACEQLQLVTCNFSITAEHTETPTSQPHSEEDLLEQFPDVFNGLESQGLEQSISVVTTSNDNNWGCHSTIVQCQSFPSIGCKRWFLAGGTW